MTYLPLTRLIAAAGGVVLPLMAGEALAMPTSKASDPVQSQSVSASVEPREDIRNVAGVTAETQFIARMEVDK